MKKNLFLIILFYVFLKPSISFSLVEIDITRGNLDPMPISVSPFFSNRITDDNIKKNLNIENLGLEISRIIENNLEKTGLFDGGIYRNMHAQPSSIKISGSFTNKNKFFIWYWTYRKKCYVH